MQKTSEIHRYLSLITINIWYCVYIYKIFLVQWKCNSGHNTTKNQETY